MENIILLLFGGRTTIFVEMRLSALEAARLVFLSIVCFTEHQSAN